MSDERRSALDRLVEAIGFSQAHVTTTCAEGHDLTPQPQLLAAIDEVKAYIAALEADRARLDWLESLPCGITLPADASYPFIASCTPKGPDWMREFVTRERQARADYAALSPSPLAPTQEGA